MKPTENKFRCGFCWKKRTEVKHLIQGECGVLICNECVGVCVEILAKCT